MNGYGSHTFSLINAQGERVWCKFHFKTMQGIENLTQSESVQLKGEDQTIRPAICLKRLSGKSIPSGGCVQVMTEEQAARRLDNL